MAVMQNSIIFGGVDSADYGIYIGGEGTFNAPKRDVEMISIPGRNGAFALDKGRFENIEVTYSAFNYETDLATFAQNLSDFRNAICSQKGYQRLTDTFHTDEYRMAAYISGLEIKPIEYNTASTFDITFDCKPQRFLTSGETEVTVASGGTILNPTLFEAKPMLEVEGYGTIGINGEEIKIEDIPLGRITINGPSSGGVIHLNGDYINAGDAFTVNKIAVQQSFVLASGATVSAARKYASGFGSASINENATMRYMTDDLHFVYGTRVLGSKAYFTIKVDYSANGTAYTDVSVDSYLEWSYDGANTITFTAGYDAPSGAPDPFIYRGSTITTESVVADSTASALGHPTYIDLDIGEAWHEDSGSVVSLNNTVQFPPELPVLESGNNQIRYDNTITSLMIKPRWWKV